MMRTVVLDTNVLLNDPRALHKFGEDDNIVLPLVVVQEMDRQKKRNDSVGQSARQFARDLDELRAYGPLHQGIRLPHGGTVRVLTDVEQPSFQIVGDVLADHYILETARSLSQDGDTILVTEDTNLRILADALGVKAVRYEKMTIKDISFYDDVRQIGVPASNCKELGSNGETLIDLSDLGVYQNEYLTIRGDNGESLLGRYDASNLLIRKVDHQTAFGITSKNREQAFALDALLDPTIQLVALAGRAGSGKTLVSIAAGLSQSMDSQLYSKVTICRPVVPLGRELGFLPGSLAEKLAPWMGSIHDSLEYIFRGAKKPKGSSIGQAKLGELEHMDRVTVEAIQYLRGRSLPNQFVLVDEAQNTSQHEIATIITRAGKGTKIVMTGDPYQIDSPYLDHRNNGLSFVIDRMRGTEQFAHVTLNKGERSELAELAAKLLT